MVYHSTLGSRVIKKEEERQRHSNARRQAPLWSKYGTHETVEARFWPWNSAKTQQTLFSCSLFAQKRTELLLGTGDAEGTRGGGAVERIWHIYDSQGQILALTLR